MHGQIPQLAAPQVVGELRTGNVDATDVVGHFFAVLQVVVFRFSISVVQADDHRDRSFLAERKSPAAHPPQNVNRLGGRVAGERHRARHFLRNGAARAVQLDAVGNAVSQRVDKLKGHPFERLGCPVAEHQAFCLALLVVEHAARADDRSRFAQIQRQVLAALRQKLEQIDQILGRNLLFKPLGHQRLGRSHQLFDVVSLDGMFFAFRIEQLDRRFAFRGQQAVHHPAVVGDHGIDAEVPLDAAAGVDDVDQQFFFGMHGHAGQVGTDSRPFARVYVTLRAMLFENLFAGRSVPLALDDRQQFFDDLLAIGIGQPAPFRQKLLGPRGDFLVGMCRQVLLLLEGYFRQRDLSRFHGVDQGVGPFAAGE